MPLAAKLAGFDFRGRALIYLDERRGEGAGALATVAKLGGRPASFLVGPEGGFAAEEFAAL